MLLRAGPRGWAKRSGLAFGFGEGAVAVTELTPKKRNKNSRTILHSDGRYLPSNLVLFSLFSELTMTSVLSSPSSTPTT